MSAYMVTQATIDALVNAGLQTGLIHRRRAKETGQILWNENQISVNYRYGEARGTTGAPIYEPTLTHKPLDLEKVLSVIANYEYQSCEHSGWEESEAFEYCDVLKDTITASGAERQDDGPWGIDDLEEITVTSDRVEKKEEDKHPEITGLVIEPDKTVREQVFTSLTDFQRAVEGYIEAVELSDGSTMYVDEEYLFKPQAEFNSIATDVCGLGGVPHLMMQGIKGPVVIVGPLKGEYDTDVTDQARKWVERVRREAVV